MNSLTKASLGFGLVLVGSMTGAQAMPAGVAAPGVPTSVQSVMYGDGCGPYAVRTWRGFCRPVGGPRFYGPRPGWGPRPFYGPRPYYRY